jgi:hypothetical protein
MKIVISIIGIIVAAVAILFISPYKIKRVCFGDVCPDNGGLYLFYKADYTKEECLAKGAYPVEGRGWVLVYAGCSPLDHALSK